MERNPFTEKLSLTKRVRLWLHDGAGIRVHGWSTRQWLSASVFLLFMAFVLLSLATFVVVDLLAGLCLLAGSLSLIGLNFHAIRCAHRAITMNRRMGW
ncbi:hypothetical protein ACIPWF_10385 [Paenarthrobacter sp. NPDC089989]|uniref:hypothetical protein n=1 Tax=unclassified Paenarthrobacter TaxID=2634190 RepID=UPI00380763B7